MTVRKFLLGALGPLAVGFACGGIKQDEIDCEEALSHLQGCCPDFVANEVQCESSQTTTDDGCNTVTTTTYPALSSAERSCILGEACGELVASGVCDRAQAARGYTTTTMTSPETTSSTGEQDTGVCP